MKKILSILILLTCIVSSTFALDAKIDNRTSSSYRTIIVYDNETEVLHYARPKVSNYYKGSRGKLYSIVWYKKGATVEQIKEWGERRAIDISADELIALDMYYNRPAEELIFMTVKDHKTLHRKGKQVSEESRRKMSETKKGKPLSEEHRKKLSIAHKGRPKSEETKRKLSEAAKNKSEEVRERLIKAHKGKPSTFKGKHHSEEAKKKIGLVSKDTYWFNNGVKNIRSKVCPEGFVPGRISWKK